MSTDTLFKQATTATGSGTDAPNWTLGVEGSSAQAGHVTAIYWAPPAGATGTVGWRVFEGHIGESHSTLGSGTLGAYTAGGGWQRFPISPVDVSGKNFMVCLYTSTHGDYAFVSGVFPVNDGILVSDQGGYLEAADGPPDHSSSLSYMIDFEFTYGSSVSQAITPAAETDAAQTLGRAKARTLGVTVETDSAIALGRSKARALGLASETDQAQAFARTKIRAVGVTVETDAAGTFGRTKTRTLGLATTTETAQPLGRVKSRTLGTVTDVSAAQPLGRTKTRALPVASETDVAVAIRGATAAGPGAPHATVRLRTVRVQVRDRPNTVTYRGSGRLN